MYEEMIIKEIECWRDRLDQLSIDIWENPEEAYHEYKASEWMAELLQEAGFEVEKGIGGLKTAIRASYGSGKPVYGLLGEYDALPGLSQKVCTHKSPVMEDGWGHGCGHNLLGTAHAGAAIGLKKVLEEKKLPGTVVFYGCPAEEALGGKARMAKEHVFDELDFCAAFHPGNDTHVSLGTATGVNSFRLNFKGKTAHAGTEPHKGRSALDALELTNIGINFLREHVLPSVRMHYIITDGGAAANIVPEKAGGLYYVRDLTREGVVEVYNRMLDVARGAALMTGTEVEAEYIAGCYPTLNNQILSKVMYETLCEIPQEPWTKEELDFASELNGNQELPEPIFTGIAPYRAFDIYGSTDVGDVQHIVPGVFFDAACWNMGAPGHSWQITACAGSSIGRRGMVYAAKAMAVFGLKVMGDSELLHRAKEEFKEKTGGRSYVCPIPD